jgi:hypothetical protein
VAWDAITRAHKETNKDHFFMCGNFYGAKSISQTGFYKLKFTKRDIYQEGIEAEKEKEIFVFNNLFFFFNLYTLLIL